VVREQIEGSLAGLSAEQVHKLVIAYEPVWAIGTGRNATVAEADEAHRYIRARLAEWFGPDAAAACRVLYGGSVKPENARELVALPDVDGCLVGGASLDVGTFYRIITTTVG
jgi:triosephosphate isomerase